MADTTDTAPRSRAQAARRKQLMDQGYSSDCVRHMHDTCKLPSCACKCHRKSAEVEPKRPELRTAKAAVSATKARLIKSEFAMALQFADGGAAKFASKYWLTPEDRLQEDERTALVNAS